jgi:hypothetical protein
VAGGTTWFGAEQVGEGVGGDVEGFGEGGLVPGRWGSGSAFPPPDGGAFESEVRGERFLGEALRCALPG